LPVDPLDDVSGGHFTPRAAPRPPE
jgi:hypothetical protein